MNAQRRASVIMVAAAVVACRDGTAASPAGREGTRARELEAVDYDLLDGATILFKRLDPYPEGHWGAFYVIDGAARQSRPGVIALRKGPAISPDGLGVAFLSPPLRLDDEYFWDIAIADLESFSETRVVRLPGNAESQPTWLPDGRLLYSIREPIDNEGAHSAFYAQAPTAGATPELLHRFTWPPGPQQCPWYDPGFAEPPSVAPNGDMAFVCSWKALHVREWSSGAIRTVYTAPWDNADHPRVLYAPAISPNASVIFVIEAPIIGRTDATGIQLRVVNADGTGMRVLATMPYGVWTEWADRNIWSACWLSAQRIAFTVPSGITLGHVNVVSTAGSAPALLTTKSDVSDMSVSCVRP